MRELTGVDLWLLLPAPIPPAARAGALALLDAEEHTRYERFVRDSDRDMFLAAHAHLRRVLSRYAPVDPETWRFTAGPHGRPAIANAETGGTLHFSLSHTDGLTAIAVAETAEIGVDVERATRRLQYDLVAERVFTPREVAWVRQRHDWLRFFVLWTLKEGYAKARGCGLSIDFRHVEFGEQPDGAYAIRLDPSLGDREAGWHFEVSRPTAEHVCAVAVRPHAAVTVRTIDAAGP